MGGAAIKAQPLTFDLPFCRFADLTEKRVKFPMKREYRKFALLPPKSANLHESRIGGQSPISPITPTQIIHSTGLKLA